MAATNDLMMRLLFQDKATPGLKQAQRNVDSFGKSISSVTSVLGAFGVALSAGAIVSGIANLAQLGAQAETVGASFDNLARSTGLASDAMLGSLRQASRGAISDMQLMQAANKAMIMGGREMGQALPQLLELARAAALATGEDMQFMFNSIVTGIARQSPLILDNLGLIVDMPGAYKRYADSVGVAVTSLTEQQKMTALLNDVLRVTPDYLQKVGADAITSTEKLQSLTTEIQNVKAELGKSISQSSLPDALAGVAKDIKNRREQQAVIKQMTGDIEYMIGLLPEGSEQSKLWAQVLHDAQIKAKIFGNTLGDAVTEASLITPELEQIRMRLLSLLPTALIYRDAMVDASQAVIAIGKQPVPPRLGPKVSPGITGFEQPQAFPMGPITRGDATAAGKHWRYTAQAIKDTTTAVDGLSYAFSNLQSKAQSALTSRMSPTGLDFLLTGMGQYQNAPLENVRRLDAIIARGFSEIKAHADWASVLKIPPEVLTGSETALKAWAMRTRDAAANLARPDLVDWDAFLKEFDRLTAEEMGRQMTLDLAMGKLASSGRLGQNQDQAKRILQSMLGLDTPETQALALGEALNKAFTASDPAGIYLNAFKAGTDQNQSKIDEISKRLGSITPDGKKAAEKYLADFNATLAALSVGTTGGGYVLP